VDPKKEKTDKQVRTRSRRSQIGMSVMGPPRGNRNALKSGLRTAEIASLRKRVGLCVRRLRAIAAFARAQCKMAETRVPAAGAARPP